MISRLLQAAPWGEWQWLVGLRGEESHWCRESVPAGGCVCVCVMCRHCQQLQSSAAHFPALHTPWQCPSCALRHTESHPLLKSPGSGQALGTPRHRLCCGGSRQISHGPALFCWEGRAEASAQCSHGESVSSASSRVIWEQQGECSLLEGMGVGNCGVDVCV